MKKFSILLLMIVFALASCASPIITQKGKNVDVKDELFKAHSDYDSNKPIIYTIDTTYMAKAFASTGAEQDQLLNLQNNAQNFGVARGKPGQIRSIRGVANRPFDVFQAEVLPGTNTIKKDEDGNPIIKPLFRVNTVPQIGFNMFIRKADNRPNTQDSKTENNNQAVATAPTNPGPQKGPDPVGKEAVEYMLKAVQTNEYVDQADNRFREGTMYEVSWDIQAYPDMYKIVQRDHQGNIKENPAYGNIGMTVIDSRYGTDLQFHYIDNGQPTIALYNFDKPDALSLIGLEPLDKNGWFWINPEYSNYHGSGWNQYGNNNDQLSGGADDQLSGGADVNTPVSMSGSQINDDNTYWDYPDREPAAYGKGGPRRLTDNIIRRDYPNGRIQFDLSVLKKYSPNFFDELWKKGWVYPHQNTFSIDPNTLQNNFPEVMENINNLAPGSFTFIKTDNPIIRKKVIKKKVIKKKEENKSEENLNEEDDLSGEVDATPLNPVIPFKPTEPDPKNQKKSDNKTNDFWNIFRFGK
ncbi:MAG: hypothetical protein V1865_01165 [bacterium]